MEGNSCYCGAAAVFEDCCGPLLKGERLAQSAVQLMRSRYSAYVLVNADYMVKTTHPKKRYRYKKQAIIDWAQESEWLRLEVLDVQETQVIFKAYYRDADGVLQTHWERSLFEAVNGSWYYVEGFFE
ncbi:YchJ family protein [Flavobacterium sp. JP2137]|uniref:YchJ family protein n=1 Tax=Flavobacterium sp. JP2137 TaxID=3414510 RepID=UPI003D300CF0